MSTYASDPPASGSLRLAAVDFELPPELIAQHPTLERLFRARRQLQPGNVLVCNCAKGTTAGMCGSKSGNVLGANRLWMPFAQIIAAVAARVCAPTSLPAAAQRPSVAPCPVRSARSPFTRSALLGALATPLACRVIAVLHGGECPPHAA